MEHRENWTQQGIAELVEAQRTFFTANQTLDVDWRLAQLKKLKSAIMSHRAALEAALRADLGRTAEEAYMLDIGTSIAEINETVASLRRWARPETHWSGLMCFPSTVTKVYKLPYGVSLIVSPFNYPVLLSLGVLTAAIAGGNTAVIKASSKSPACTAALRDLIADCFPADYVTVVSGGHETADACLAQRFDKIFYTGSPKVGRHVLETAAGNLTSVGLELGRSEGRGAEDRFLQGLQQRPDLHRHQPGRGGTGGGRALPARAESGFYQTARRKPGGECGVFPHDLPRGL